MERGIACTHLDQIREGVAERLRSAGVRIEEDMSRFEARDPSQNLVRSVIRGGVQGPIIVSSKEDRYEPVRASRAGAFPGLLGIDAT